MSTKPLSPSAGRAYDGWKRHRYNIRDVGQLKGETFVAGD